MINKTGLSFLAVVAAYLLGAIPTGYLIARSLRGIDIRTVGSGNIGATNVGRILGTRFFWIVLILDLLKGLFPTIAFPRLIGHFLGSIQVDLPVLIGLAAILGHTFPLYLQFRGGKGVATSLGVILALDPISCIGAAIVFGLVLWFTRYMSLASLIGGVGFASEHLFREAHPFSREHIAMSLFSIAVVGLLIVRHRSNLARILAGTENKVNIRRARWRAGDLPLKTNHTEERNGRVIVFVLLGLVLFSTVVISAVLFIRNANRTLIAEAGPWTLLETDRLVTGQQRIERVSFTPHGDRLAGICPRYNHLLIQQIDTDLKLRPISETQLDGRPVGIVPFGGRFIVLQRPPGDQKHVELGWWEVFDRDGKKVGSRNSAGFYPDDLAVSPNGRLLYVLSSGRAEGDQNKPPPAFEICAIEQDGSSPRLISRIDFDPADDPVRLTISASGQFAAVLLAKSKRTVAVDLTKPESPRLLGKTLSVNSEVPYVSASSDKDWIMMPGIGEGDTIAIQLPDKTDFSLQVDGAVSVQRADYLISTRQSDSALEVIQRAPHRSLGSFPLFGPLNLGRTRPTGLAYSATRGLIAVATRSGTIHIIKLQSRISVRDGQSSSITTTPSETLKR